MSINKELGSQPSLLNKSPEDKGTAHAECFSIHIRLLRPFIIGWLFQLKLTNPKEVDFVHQPVPDGVLVLTYINSSKAYCRIKTTLSIASRDA